MAKFEASFRYRTVCGEIARIVRITETRMYGTLVKFPSIQLVWDLEGRRFPRAGVDPYDLEANRTTI